MVSYPKIKHVPKRRFALARFFVFQYEVEANNTVEVLRKYFDVAAQVYFVDMMSMCNGFGLTQRLGKPDLKNAEYLNEYELAAVYVGTYGLVFTSGADYKIGITNAYQTAEDMRGQGVIRFDLALENLYDVYRTTIDGPRWSYKPEYR